MENSKVSKQHDVSWGGLLQGWAQKPVMNKGFLPSLAKSQQVVVSKLLLNTPVLGEMIQIDERDLSNPLVQPPGTQGMSHLTTPSSSKGKWTFFVSPLKFFHILQGGPYQS